MPYTMVILIALLSAALFYLGSRALITRWLWSRYPPRFATFMDCSACTGFWYGFLIAHILGHASVSYLGIDLRLWWAPIVVGLCSIVLTPITAGLMQRGLDALGHIETSEP